MSAKKKRDIRSFDEAIEALQVRQNQNQPSAVVLNGAVNNVINDLIQGAIDHMDSTPLKDQLQGFKNQAAEKVEQLTTKARENTQKAVKEIDEQAHRTPWLFVAVASVFALLLGFVLGGRRNR
jgi:ElaB/YqjD/DUF883 family membrane-anchored ribosome-binding protein